MTLHCTFIILETTMLTKFSLRPKVSMHLSSFQQCQQERFQFGQVIKEKFVRTREYCGILSLTTHLKFLNASSLVIHHCVHLRIVVGNPGCKYDMFGIIGQHELNLVFTNPFFFSKSTRECILRSMS